MMQVKVNYDKLTNEELVRLYKLNDDSYARDYLVMKNKKLVYKAASSKKGVSLLDYEDLVQEGLMGLIVGIEKFDINYPSKFSTYIYYWIKQRIDRAIYNTGSTVRLPIHLVSKLNKLIYMENLANVKNMDLNITEICNYLSITEEQYSSYKVLINQFKNVISLNSMINDDNGETDDELIDFMSNGTNIVSGSVAKELSVESYVMDKNLAISLEEALSTLKERERKILRLRYGLEDGEAKTLEEVGDVFNVTRERIRQIESKALQKLRNPKILNKLESYHYQE